MPGAARAAAAASLAAASHAEQWAAADSSWSGSLDYHPYAANVPLNVTVNAGVAAFDWVWDHDAGNHKCSADHEIGLNWTVDGSTITAIGLGKDPSYYSFRGQLSGDTVSGDVLEHQTKVVGTWTATRGAAMKPSTCVVPTPVPTPPGPVGLPELWPVPRNYSTGSVVLAVTPSAAFFSGDGLGATVTAAFARYMLLCFPHRATAAAARGAGPTLVGLRVSVDSADESFPQLGTDESYSLDVPAGGGSATLNSKTAYGALRGLETFSQLVAFDFDAGAYVLRGAPWAVDDAPRFPHRGLMIDTARHFQPLRAVRSVVDSLPYAKLNVLHWHMSDTQSFPFESTKRPALWQGAWSKQERYTQADVADVVEYARLRGVRVIVEFDMPGHAGSWCAGYPEVCPSTSCTQPLNVAANATFDLITDLLSECTGGRASAPGDPSPGVFKDNFIHLGGDEVNTKCWSSTPSIAAWLQARGMSADDGYAYFVKRVASIAIAQGHRPVQWSEVYDHFKSSLAKETIVHIWKSVTNVTEVVADGYQVLLNVGYNARSWYLDNLDVEWPSVYANEPCAGVPDDLCHFIIGGHGEMWGETVDASDVEQTVWPRLAAIAERLWSPRVVTSATDALRRIESFRCLLNRRGVRAAPVTNGHARSAPGGPGSCFQQ